MTQKTLTYAERLILSNQLTILQKIDPDQAEYYSEAQEIVNSGYEALYGDINASVYDETVPYDICKETMEILDMFRALEYSCRKLGVEAKDLNADFDGFDGNATEGHHGFARFLRRTQGKWSELKSYPDNSHSSATLNSYRLMIERWHRIGRSFEMSEAQIREVVG